MVVSRALQPPFGHAFDSPRFAQFAQNCGIVLTREPAYPDSFQHFDYLDFEDVGIRLVFGDEAYYRADGRFLQRKPLILTNVSYYGGNRYYQHERFAGQLPHSLTWEDSRQTASNKLGRSSWRWDQAERPYLLDRWDFQVDGGENYWLLVSYAQDASAIEHIQVGWAVPPGSVVGEDKPHLRFRDLAPLLHRAWNSSAVRQTYVSYPVEESIDACDGGCAEVDSIIDDGVELYFDEPIEDDQRDDEGGVYRFSGIRMFRFGDSNSRGFDGELPHDLVFSDKPEVMLRKVGTPPVAGSTDEFSGYFVWRLDAYLLHILYSVQEQRIDRVTVIAHGYYEADLLE